MKKRIITIMVMTAMLASCNGKRQADLSENPLVNPGEYFMSAPDFSKIKVEHYRPAFEEGIRLHQEEIDAITNNPEAPTFENTIVALERSGAVLTRTSAIFFSQASAHTNEEIQKIEIEIAPKLSAHGDKMYLSDALFQRVKTVYEKELASLKGEDARLLQEVYDNFERAGATLDAAGKEKLAKLNQEEAELLADFGTRLNNASQEPMYFTKEELAGLGEAELKVAAEEAQAEGHDGEYLIRLENTSQQTIFLALNNRTTRQKIYEASINRCIKGNINDTQGIVLRLAKLRAEKAELLGKKNFAEWKLQNQLAKNPETVISFLSNLATLAAPRAEADRAELEEFARKSEGNDFVLEPWDWAYYAEKLRADKYGIDEATIMQYIELETLLENGVFYAANKMFGLSFKPRTDLSVYHPDVRVYDVIDSDGNQLALFYFDPFARPSKSGGAWMSNWVEQSHLLGLKPVIYNVCNIPKPAAGEPALVSWDQTQTLFHEFGHALHGMFANQKYPSLSGTNVPRDFVEMPSQFNEHCASDPDIFAHYIKHYKTGEPMPAELKAKMEAAGRFNQAYALVENVAACLLDMAWHTLSLEEANAIQSVADFQNTALLKYKVEYRCIPPRYGSSYFRHIWSNGYSAGYYAYLWTEAIDNDIFAWMQQNGGINRENGLRYRDLILSRGNSEDLMSLFTQLTGHSEVDIKPLLKSRGLQ